MDIDGVKNNNNNNKKIKGNYTITKKKMGKCPFKKKKKKKIQYFSLFHKLIRKMPLFWNSIFSKSSYLKKKKFRTL